jgi:hypothetical protein
MGDIGPIKRTIEVLPDDEPLQAPAQPDPTQDPAIEPVPAKKREPVG